jgi:hypothetical protein
MKNQISFLKTNVTMSVSALLEDHPLDFVIADIRRSDEGLQTFQQQNIGVRMQISEVATAAEEHGHH